MCECLGSKQRNRLNTQQYSPVLIKQQTFESLATQMELFKTDSGRLLTV